MPLSDGLRGIFREVSRTDRIEGFYKTSSQLAKLNNALIGVMAKQSPTGLYISVLVYICLTDPEIPCFLYPGSYFSIMDPYSAYE